MFNLIQSFKLCKVSPLLNHHPPLKILDLMDLPLDIIEYIISKIENYKCYINFIKTNKQLYNNKDQITYNILKICTTSLYKHYNYSKYELINWQGLDKWTQFYVTVLDYKYKDIILILMNNYKTNNTFTNNVLNKILFRIYEFNNEYTNRYVSITPKYLIKNHFKKINIYNILLSK